MRALLQRVTEASVTVEGEVIGEIGPGLLILVCAMPEDTEETAEKLALKVSKLRLFKDEGGKMNLSLAQTGGSALVVSQFTLHASTKKGNRPSFIRAARPEHSEPLYERFCSQLGGLLGKDVGRGRFGAMMDVALVNDGPVTIWMDTSD